MPRKFSEDLCWRIIYLYTEGLPTTEIANTLHMSKGVVNKIKKRYNRWACVNNPFKNVPNQRKLFSSEDLAILRNLVREKVNWYLDKLIYEMECLIGKRASIATLWRSLHYLGITQKKVNYSFYNIMNI